MTRTKQNGINNELLFKFLFNLEYPRADVKLYSNKGVDIIVSDFYKFEIKSCEYLIKNGKYTRKGRFIIRTNDFDCNWFVFIIPEIRLFRIIEKEHVLNLIIKKQEHFFENNRHVKLSQKEIKELPWLKISNLFIKVNFLNKNIKVLKQ